MKRYPLETTKIAEHTVRYTLKLQADDNDSSLKALVQLFRDLADQPLLLKCGPNIPENINIHFNGEFWILTGTAEEQLDMANMMFGNDENGANPYGH